VDLDRLPHTPVDVPEAPGAADELGPVTDADPAAPAADAPAPPKNTDDSWPQSGFGSFP
jgi:hypothetical protein